MMAEVWKPIKDFPGYEVSDGGGIWSDRSGMRLLPSPNTTGIMKINLMRQGLTITRSVKTLVAEAFLDQQLTFEIAEDDKPTAINIDGDQRNCRADNLAWRPRWFAWKYTHQFNETIPREYLVQIVNERTGIIYPSVMEAGIAEGLLWEHVYDSMLSGKPVYPTGSHFDFLFNSV